MYESRTTLRASELVRSCALGWGVGLPCTNWSEAEAAFLMSPRQGETSQHSSARKNTVPLLEGQMGLVSRYVRTQFHC